MPVIPANRKRRQVDVWEFPGQAELHIETKPMIRKTNQTKEN